MTNFTFSKSSLTAALLAGSMLATPALAVTIEGNIGATTDYIWRGNTQSSGDASISGGIDVDLGSGFADRRLDRFTGWQSIRNRR
jgi:uncharacterized protein (TIGR02001 family)